MEGKFGEAKGKTRRGKDSKEKMMLARKTRRNLALWQCCCL